MVPAADLPKHGRLYAEACEGNAGRSRTATTSPPTSATLATPAPWRWSTSITKAPFGSWPGASCGRSPTRLPTCSRASQQGRRPHGRGRLRLVRGARRRRDHRRRLPDRPLRSRVGLPRAPRRRRGRRRRLPRRAPRLGRQGLRRPRRRPRALRPACRGDQGLRPRAPLRLRLPAPHRVRRLPAEDVLATPRRRQRPRGRARRPPNPVARGRSRPRWRERHRRCANDAGWSRRTRSSRPRRGRRFRSRP